MPGLKIAYRDPTLLKPRARNPRTHTPKQIKQIAASIEQFGLSAPFWSTQIMESLPATVV